MEQKEKEMKITSVRPVGRKPVYDLSVAEVEHYALKNGVITHNTGGMYSANQVFIISKAQEKDGTQLLGYKFTINIEKSRYVREKSKFPFYVKFEGGIDKWSGLFDIALELEFLKKISAQKYSQVDPETGEIFEASYKRKELDTKDFWIPMLSDKRFQDAVKQRYQLGQDALIREDIEETE